MISRVTVLLRRCLYVTFLMAASSAGASDIPWVWHSSRAPEHTREIALLLDHMVLSGNRVDVRRRMRRLSVDGGVLVTPVVHVQSDAAAPPVLGADQTKMIVESVLAAARQSTSTWVQLDFEVVESQWPYYSELVATLRRELPPPVRLSVTALASWCADARLRELAADEVVPMFFRMGAAAKEYRQRLISAPERLDARCRGPAAGFAVQEAPPHEVLRRYQRLYWFNFDNWNNPSREE